MGGKVALTVRASETEEYRGSCWTNLLPLGLFAPDFYVDLESSRRHAWAWVQELLEHRRLTPSLERMWGGHGMCAPVGYGIVLVDYVTSTLVSAQGYSFPNRAFVLRNEAGDDRGRWDRLGALGLLQDVARDAEFGWQSARISLPFSTARVSDVDSIDVDMVDMVRRTVGLSDEEGAVWTSWIKGYSD